MMPAQDRRRRLDGATAMKTIVTTASESRPEDSALARAEAERLGLPFVERAGSSRARLLARTGASAILVVTGHELALWLEGHRVPLRFHGGLGVSRVRSLRRGGRDALVTACGVKPGDRVVDATAGRCSDALVLEQAVGPGGAVVALEKSGPIHAVMAAGLHRSGSRIELLWCDHHEWLRSQPDASVDLVLFDPMFRTPGAADLDFPVLRAFADPRPLDEQTLSQARRVARRGVAVLDSPPGRELARLRLTDVTEGQWAARRVGLWSRTER